MSSVVRVPDEVLAHIKQIAAMQGTAAGEMIDIDFSTTTDVPRVHDVITMERFKTAVYSFECPLQAGAVLAGASEEAVQALGRFGREIGIAYQIVDDLLGVFGIEAETGKTTIGDLREGKRTVLIAFATSTKAWPLIEALVGKPNLSHEEADFVREVLVSSGTRDFTEGLARNYTNEALAHLRCADIPVALRRELEPLAATVLERVK